MASSVRFSRVPGTYAVARLDPRAAWPEWALRAAGFVSVTRTAEEWSVVVSAEQVPAGVTCETGWALFKVEGPLPFALVGVMAALARPLAEAGISLLALGTYDTDYLLVKAVRAHEAVAALTAAGHVFIEERQA